MRIPKFLENATNVYRTKKYIVKQNACLEYDEFGNGRVFSEDTYYLRNKQLDKEFEFIFKNRGHINGKRVHTTLYTRRYK